MSRIRSRSSKDSKQGSAAKKSRRGSDSVAEQLIDQAGGHTSTQSHHDSDLGSRLLAYNFIIPLVVEYLNDGDVIARLLTINKSIKKVLLRYAFKRVCDVSLALAILESDPGITLSVTRVQATELEWETLHQVVELNREPLREVHYSNRDQHNAISTMHVPRCVTHLDLYPDGNAATVKPGMIPDSVVNLMCSSSLEVDSIPSSVQTAKLSMRTYRPELIPATVTNLELTLYGPSANSSNILVPGMFSSSLKQLHLPTHTDPFVAGVIPSSVITLACCYKLLTVLDVGVIPDSVTMLRISSYECHNIIKENVVPKSVTHLSLSVGRLDLASFPMPPLLTHLSLRSTVFTGRVPDTVTHLDVFSELTPGELPNSIKYMRLIGWHNLDSNIIPPSVTHLEIESGWGRWGRKVIVPGDIPPTVTHLIFSCTETQKMTKGIIPSSVTHLTFDSSFNRPIPGGVIPDSVTHLVFGDAFNRDLTTKALPRGLKHLCFGKSFNKPIRSHCLPPLLETLVFGEEFDQAIKPSAIPKTVNYLAFGSGFTHHIDETSLPDALRYLEIPRGYVKHDDECWLPASLTHFSHQRKSVSERPTLLDTAWNLQQFGAWCCDLLKRNL